MTATLSSGYSIISESDEHSQRVIAVGMDGVEIVGAYRPVPLNDWRVYVSKLISQRTGLPQPHKTHACSRADALRWVETLAWLYTHSEVTS